MQPTTVARIAGVGLIAVVALIALSQSTYVVEPGYRGVMVTLGKVSQDYKPEGFGTKMPFVTNVIPVAVRQQTREADAECYSSDLQQVNMRLRVLYRLPEASVVSIYKDYQGDPFDSLVAPRVQEALKEVTATLTAELIVKRREDVKESALKAAREKIGDLIDVADLVIENISLSNELESAIEAKMVQEQEAAKARFVQQKTQIEADTAIIKAKGEAEAIRIRGDALRSNPALVDLQIVEKWDGRAPLVISTGGGAGSGGSNILLPIGDVSKLARPLPPSDSSSSGISPVQPAVGK